MSGQQELHSEVDYFASMTDMMVGVLFVFIIMVAYFAFQVSSEDHVPISLYEAELDKNKALLNENHQFKKKVATLEQEIERLEQPDPIAEYISKSSSQAKELISDVVQQLRDNGIDAHSRRTGVVTISGKGLFAPGQSNLDSLPQARERVQRLARILQTNIRCFTLEPSKPKSDYKSCNPDLLFLESVYLEGHTDNEPVSIQLQDGSRNNLELSARRATNTYQAMTGYLPTLTQLKNAANEQVLSVAAYGEQRPIADNNTEAGRHDNRRIDIRFVPHVFKNHQALAEFKTLFDKEHTHD